MKRSPMPARSAPMRRSKSLPVRSERAVRATRSHAEVRAAVFARDGYRCLLSGARCLPGLTVHHLLKASQGGKYVSENLVTLCAPCNSAVEDHPRLFHTLGLVCRRGETLEECWAKLRSAGLVRA